MATTYATLVSALNIINNLQLHPSPPSSLPIKQVESLTQKINFLLQFLEGYNPHRGYSKEADPLESHIADAAYAAEHAIESHIFEHYTNNGENMSYDFFYVEALEKVIEDMASIEEEAKQIQGRVGVQHQLHTKSIPSDSSTSSSIPQQSSIVGVDDVKLQMIDKLTSHCYDLSKIKNMSYDGLYEALEKVIQDMASIKEEIQGRVGLQHQLHTKSTPSDSTRSSSIPQQSSMVGADDVKLQLMDKLTSHCRDLEIIPIVGMGGSDIRLWFLLKEYQRNTRSITATGKEPFKFVFISLMRMKKDLRAWIVLTLC